jgi:Zn-dependent protease with chaperone function
VSYPALLHNPVDGSSRQVTLAWDPRFYGSLRIDDAGAVQEIAAKDLTLTRGGWSGDAIHLTWEQDGQTWAVTLDNPQAIASLAKELPSEMSGPIVAWRKHSKRSGRWSTLALTIAAIVTLLPLVLLIALFLMRDRILDIVIDRMPVTIDAEIGQLLHRELDMSGKLVKDGAAVDALRLVSRRFAPHLPKDFEFRFEVVNDGSVNAFAAPGGLVVVHTGLLAKASSADELVGVLSHEITHVTQRHSLRQMIYNLGLTTTLRWLLGVPDGVADTIAGAAADLSGLQFSRDQETSADVGGIELLQKARLPAAGLKSFFEKMAQDQQAIPAFLSTHPADEERAAMLQKMVDERGQWEVDPLAIDWDAVRQDAEGRMKLK